MFSPVAGGPFWIGEPVTRRTGKGDNEDVIPLVMVEIADKNQEVVIGVSVPIGILRIGGIILVTFFEIGAFVPIGSGNKVEMPVPIQFSKGRPFSMVFR